MRVAASADLIDDREYAAPPELVFEAWTKAEHFARWCRTRPARSRTRRCLHTAGPLMSNGRDSSFTFAGPAASRFKIARRVGSASAANVWLNASACITRWLPNRMVRLDARRIASHRPRPDRSRRAKREADREHPAFPRIPLHLLNNQCSRR